jgi:hypothetical protein
MLFFVLPYFGFQREKRFWVQSMVNGVQKGAFGDIMYQTGGKISVIPDGA